MKILVDPIVFSNTFVNFLRNIFKGCDLSWQIPGTYRFIWLLAFKKCQHVRQVTQIGGGDVKVTATFDFHSNFLPQWYFIFLFYKVESKFIWAEISLGRVIVSYPFKEDSFKSWSNKKILTNWGLWTCNPCSRLGLYFCLP